MGSRYRWWRRGNSHDGLGRWWQRGWDAVTWRIPQWVVTHWFIGDGCLRTLIGRSEGRRTISAAGESRVGGVPG